MSLDVFNPGLRCPNCGSTNIIRDEKGAYVCNDCGLVVVPVVVDHGPEWRNFAGERDRSRVGPPQSPMSWRVGSEISVRKFDGLGRKLSMKSLVQARANAKLHRMIASSGSKEKNLIKARSHILDLKRLLEDGGVYISDKVVETAMLYYRKYVVPTNSRVRSIKCVASAALLAACRVMDVGISITDFSAYAEKLGVSPRSLRRCYKKLRLSILGNKVGGGGPNTNLYLRRAAASLNLPPRVMILANKIIGVASEKGLTSGKSRRGLAAAAMYISAKIYNYNVTQEMVARALKTTPVTVRERYKDLIKNMEISASI